MPSGFPKASLALIRLESGGGVGSSDLFSDILGMYLVNHNMLLNMQLMYMCQHCCTMCRIESTVDKEGAKIW